MSGGDRNPGVEWAAEIADQTTHGILNVGWVPDGTRGYRGQMAVLVAPNGLVGGAYMATIRPFRRMIVCPAMLSSERTAAAGGWNPASLRHRRLRVQS